MNDDPDGWLPVLSEDGRTYCSRRCGFKCTKEEHDERVGEAAALCRVLGDGWQPRIWENVGWHCSAILDLAADRGVLGPARIELHPTHSHRKPGKVTYSCYFNSAAGQVLGETSADPLEALASAVEKVQAKVTIYQQDLGLVLGKTRSLVLRLLR